MKYFIYWKSCLTGYIGHGECFDIDSEKIKLTIQKLDSSCQGNIIHYYLESQYYDAFVNDIPNWPIGM